MNRIGVFCLVACLSALVSAEEKWDFAQPLLQACEAGPASTLDWRLCVDAEYQKADKELNKIYKELTTSLVNPSDLVRAEAEWIKFRNYSCAFETSAFESGTVSQTQQTLYSACLFHHTKIRINELKRLSAMKCGGCPERKNP